MLKRNRKWWLGLNFNGKRLEFPGWIFVNKSNFQFADSPLKSLHKSNMWKSHRLAHKHTYSEGYFEIAKHSLSSPYIISGYSGKLSLFCGKSSPCLNIKIHGWSASSWLFVRCLFFFLTKLNIFYIIEACCSSSACVSLSRAFSAKRRKKAL